MRDALVIAWREFSVRVFRWTFWIVGLGVPAIGILFVLGVALGTAGDQRSLLVVDDVGALDQRLVEHFEDDPLLVVTAADVAPTGALPDGVAGVLTLDAETRSTGVAHLRGGKALPTAHDEVLREAVQFVLLEEALVQAGMSDAVLEGVELDFEDLDGSAESAEAVRLGTGFAVAGIMILWLTLAGHPLQVLLSVLEEKESGLVEAVLGVTTARSLLMGKIIGLGGVAVVQGMLWFSPFLFLGGLLRALSPRDGEDARTLEGLPGIDDVFVFGLALVLGYLSMTLIAAILASLLPGKQHADSANMALMVLGFVPVAIGLPAASNPMALGARVFTFLPPFAPIVAFARYPSGGPVIEIAIGFGISALFVVGMLWAADRIFLATALGAWKPRIPFLST